LFIANFQLPIVPLPIANLIALALIKSAIGNLKSAKTNGGQSAQCPDRLFRVSG